MLRGLVSLAWPHLFTLSQESIRSVRLCVLHIFTSAERPESLARLHTTVPTTDDFNVFFLDFNRNAACVVQKKNEFIVTPSAANNYATKANVGPADNHHAS